MRSSALLSFVPSGLLIPFFRIALIGVGFMFDAPIRSLGDKIVRETIAWIVICYPVVWLIALALTVVALFRDWSARTLIALAVLPFFVALAPFVLAGIHRYV